jgi:acetyltransferase-like isoleucine patch superfamily enzyme
MTMTTRIIIDRIFRFIESVIRRIFLIANTTQARLRLGSAGKKIRIYYPNDFLFYSNIFIGNNVLINKNSIFVCSIAKIIIKDNVQIGKNALFVAGNHNVTEIGRYMKDVNIKLPSHDKGITINEDVFIIFNVTILDGVTVGRGAIIGTGAVVRKSVPPYAIVVGNPAKIISFRFTPGQIIEHEKLLYNEQDRIPLEVLEKNYEKYYLKRLGEITAII